MLTLTFPSVWNGNGVVVSVRRSPSRVTVLTWHVELGGLMAYSFDVGNVACGNARQIAEILKGANPGDIPFRQATKFQLVINVKAARALGLEMPSALLLRA